MFDSSNKCSGEIEGEEIIYYLLRFYKSLWLHKPFKIIKTKLVLKPGISMLRVITFLYDQALFVIEEVYGHWKR